MNLLDIKRITGLDDHDLVRLSHEVKSAGGDPDRLDDYLREAVTGAFTEATETLDAAGLTWDQVTSVLAVRRKLGITAATLDKLLEQRKITPVDFGILGHWLTDDQVQACRRLA